MGGGAAVDGTEESEGAGVRLELIGPFRVVRGSSSLPERDVGSRKGRTLLKLLAVHRGSPVPVDVIVECLWADDPPPKARENVSSLVSRLRSLLGADAVETVGDGYRLAAGAGVIVDVDAVSALVEEAEARLAAREPSVAAVAAARANALLEHGELLADEPYAEWAATARASLERLRRRARRAAWVAGLAVPDPDLAIRSAEAAIADDPLDEEAYRALMLGQHAATGPAAALTTYERPREVLAEALGADPSPETRAVHLAILRDEPAPPTSAEAPVPGPSPGRRDAGFVGREAELSRASEAWSRAAAGSPSMLIVSGESGIGKTRFATEVVGGAERAGALVLSARCYEAERSVFLQPVLDAFRSTVVSAPPDAVRTAAGEWAGTLADIIPEIGVILRPIGYTRSTPDVERRRVFEALSTFLRRLVRRRAAILFLDDLQNAGSSTLEFLHFLTRRLSGDRILLVATLRADEGTEAWSALGGFAERLELGPLPDPAVRALAGAIGASAAVASEVLYRTRGHTLFVIEALRAAAEAGGEAPSAVPDSLREAVVARARRIGLEHEELLRTAAVLGSAFDVATVAALAEVPVGVAAARAERALQAGLLVESGTFYEFANDLIREVLYSTTPGPTRAARHLQAASLLRGNPEAVALHAAAGADWTLAGNAWRAAADRAARRFANRDALEMLDHALGAARTAEDRGAEARTLHARGRVREALGEWAGAYEDHTRVIELARETGDRDTEMRSLCELGGDLQVGRGGSTAACVEPLREALALAEDLDDHRMQICALTRLCVVRSNMLRFDEGVAHGNEGLRVARSHGVELDLALALDGLKMAAAYMGEVELVTRYTSELERILLRHGEEWLLVWTLLESSFAPTAGARFDDAVASLRAAAAIAQRIGETRITAPISILWAWVERARGAYADALRLGQAGATAADMSRHPWWVSFANSMLAWIWTELGQPERAVEHGERAVAAAERDGVANWLVRAEAHLAWAAWAAGDRGRAAVFADRAEATLATVRTPLGRVFLHGAHAYVATARVRLGQGRFDRVDALLEPLLPAAQSASWLEAVVDMSTLLGRARRARGLLDEAEPLLRRGAELAGRHGFARATWEANAALAGLLRQQERRDEALEHDRLSRDALDRAAASIEDASARAVFLERALAVLQLEPV